MPKESETPRETEATGSCGSDPVARPSLTWLELLSEPWGGQAVLQALSAGAAFIEELFRQLPRVVEATRRLLESPWLQALLKELSRPGWADRAASAYCAPYQQEVAELGLTPLNEEERFAFMVFASVLAEPEELALGRRPPLLQVAVAGGRLDVALALLLQQGLESKALRSLDVADSDVRDDLVGQAALALGETILPALQRRMNGLGIGGLGELKPLLAEVTKDAYLVVAIRRELMRYLKKEALRHKREAPTEPAALEAELLCAPEQERLLDYWAVEQSIARCLNRPRAKAIDAQILAAIGDKPGRSSASIARELGLPETTVRYRRRLLMEFLRQDVRS